MHYKLLPTDQAISADLYSQQVERAQQALMKKEPVLFNRKCVLFLDDNAKHHVASVARYIIWRFG